MLYWLKRLALNVRGFLAALLATVLPGATPFVRKLLAGWVTSMAIILHHKLGLDYAPGPEFDGLITTIVDVTIAGLGNFALWRVPNEAPKPADLKNPIVGTATDVPPT